MYPLAQAYDSVFLRSDVEIGGTDQKFNLLLGRDLQKEFNQQQQTILTMPLIEGTDGVDKMSKSYDNYIGISESASDMYGKTLSIPDLLIGRYFEFVTDISKSDLVKIKLDLEGGLSNPRDLKRKLARKIVEFYHGKELSIKAENDFDAIFIKKDEPEDIPEYILSDSKILIDLLVENNMVSSN